MIRYDFTVHAATVDLGLRLAHQQARSFFLEQAYEFADVDVDDEIVAHTGAVVARTLKVSARAVDPDLWKHGYEA